MKKAIGSLLVVSMLTNPSVLRVDYMAYEVYKNHHQIINVLIKEMEEKDQIKEVANINEIMGDIENKRQNISNLLKIKNKITSQIQALLDLRAYTKKPLNESQIKLFVEFTSITNNEGGLLKEALLKIDDKKNLSNAKWEILHNDSDYGLIYDELKTINDYQSDAIYSLNMMITAAERTLEAL